MRSLKVTSNLEDFLHKVRTEASKFPIVFVTKRNISTEKRLKDCLPSEFRLLLNNQRYLIKHDQRICYGWFCYFEESFTYLQNFIITMTNNDVSYDVNFFGVILYKKALTYLMGPKRDCKTKIRATKIDKFCTYKGIFLRWKRPTLNLITKLDQVHTYQMLNEIVGQFSDSEILTNIVSSWVFTFCFREKIILDGNILAVFRFLARKLLTKRSCLLDRLNKIITRINIFLATCNKFNQLIIKN
jgi:hypothetical protein